MKNFRNLIVGFITMGQIFGFSICHGQIAIKSDGKIIVGDNSFNPTGIFQVKSSGNGGLPFVVTHSGGIKNLFEVQQGGIGAGNFFIYDASGNRTIQFAGQGRFFVSSPGNVGIDQQNPSFDFELGTENGGNGIAAKPGGGMWVATSDMRSKKSIIDYSRGLSELMQIRPVRYSYNGKFGTKKNSSHVGVVAQELKEVAPEMIIKAVYNIATLEQMESPDYIAKNYQDEFLAVDPSDFLYMLINATKEQQLSIEQLKEENEYLKREIIEIRQLNNGDGTINNIDVTLDHDKQRGYISQNAPNPFSNSTQIRYYIPPNAKSATINISDITGTIVKVIEIKEAGIGILTLSRGEVVSGNYIYSLYIDNKIIESKQFSIHK